jgi:hypothetical protein
LFYAAWNIATSNTPSCKASDAAFWKWSATVAGVKISGQGSTRDGAIADAEKAIDRALTPKKRRLERKHFGHGNSRV